MECKDFVYVIIIYLLFEILKTKTSRENFKRKHNGLHVLLRDKDGNVQTMELKDIYDSIQEAKTASNNHTNHLHNESKKHTNNMHNHAKNHANVKAEQRAKHWAVHHHNGVKGWANTQFIKKNQKIALKSHGNNHWLREDWGKIYANIQHYNEREGRMKFTISSA